jgi:hypothetical protein
VDGGWSRSLPLPLYHCAIIADCIATQQLNYTARPVRACQPMRKKVPPATAQAPPQVCLPPLGTGGMRRITPRPRQPVPLSKQQARLGRSKKLPKGEPPTPDRQARQRIPTRPSLSVGTLPSPAAHRLPSESGCRPGARARDAPPPNPPHALRPPSPRPFYARPYTGPRHGTPPSPQARARASHAASSKAQRPLSSTPRLSPQPAHASMLRVWRSHHLPPHHSHHTPFTTQHLPPQSRPPPPSRPSLPHAGLPLRSVHTTDTVLFPALTLAHSGSAIALHCTAPPHEPTSLIPCPLPPTPPQSLPPSTPVYSGSPIPLQAKLILDLPVHMAQELHTLAQTTTRAHPYSASPDPRASLLTPACFESGGARGTGTPRRSC